MPFENRTAAGRRLAAAVAVYRNDRPVVLALPRGGVPVAAEVAAALGAPLDLLLVRKLGVPFQPELAMGAVVDGAAAHIVRNEQIIRDLGISEQEFAAVCERELAEIERRRRQYLGNRTPVEIADRTAIVVDDGVATGATIRAALEALGAHKPRRLVLAVPVMAPDALAALSRAADDIVCLEVPEPFEAVGSYYADFRQVSDEEVMAILRRFPAGSELPADRPLRVGAGG